MSKAALVIMAAGIGSRFGGGIKQLEAVGPNGEIIMDYSIYDAKAAGFDKVVFVIRRDLEQDFKKVIGSRIEKIMEVAYAYQELNDLPDSCRGRFADRKKPWGTGQAILCCAQLVQEPFLVINADDYYGKQAFCKAHEYLMSKERSKEKLHLGMVGFTLGNTLSENGSVTRGVCRVDKDHMLTEIEETHNIVKTPTGAGVAGQNNIVPLDVNAVVSMNMWALTPDIFPVLAKEFTLFLDQLEEQDEKNEYLLPSIIGKLLLVGHVSVRVLESKDQWFGVTYKEDKKNVSEAIKKLIVQKIYPEKLFD